MYALVDCNNFFASCERAFNPALVNRPVVVLSNNDGCVVARSNEAKALGITMGVPFYQVQDIIEQFNVAVFSSNFALYGDISARVMQTLKMFAPNMEIYSIDEAFLDLTGINSLIEHALNIRRTVWQWVNIPVCVGMAPTKTLAKVANHLAKKQSRNGIWLLENNIDNILSTFPIEDLWGIGASWSRKLRALGIINALDLKNSCPHFIGKQLNVVAKRMVLELNGVSCLPLVEKEPLKKSITCSRSFSHPVNTEMELTEAISHFAAKAGQKLRREQQAALEIGVFIRTSPYRTDEAQHRQSLRVRMPVATNQTGTLISYAKTLLQAIYKAGFNYRKAGVILSNFLPETVEQQDLFSETATEVNTTLMYTVDTINEHYGNNTVFHAAEGIRQHWQGKKQKQSPRYTTCWQELVRVK